MMKINLKRSLIWRATANKHVKLRSMFFEPITNMSEMLVKEPQAPFTKAEHWKFFSLSQIAKFWLESIFFMRKKKVFSSISWKSMYFGTILRKICDDKIGLELSRIVFFTPCCAKIKWKFHFTTLYFLETSTCSQQLRT